MSDLAVVRLRRAVSEGKDIRVKFEDGHDFRAEAAQAMVDHRLAEDVDGESPPHGWLVVDVIAYRGELPDGGRERNVIIDIREAEDGGWTNDGMLATWKTEGENGIEEETRGVRDVEVVSDE